MLQLKKIKKRKQSAVTYINPRLVVTSLIQKIGSTLLLNTYWKVCSISIMAFKNLCNIMVNIRPFNLAAVITRTD